MKNIRYDLHFMTLILAAPVVWAYPKLPVPPGDIFFYSHYALIGALYATALVVSLRRSKPIARATAFVLLAAVVSAAAPWAGLLSPHPAAFGDGFNFLAMFLVASAFGAAGYWLLVRLFWLKMLRPADMMTTVTLCAAATLLSFLFAGQLHERGLPVDLELVLTVAWWFAFSASLYWSESRAQARMAT